MRNEQSSFIPLRLSLLQFEGRRLKQRGSVSGVRESFMIPFEWQIFDGDEFAVVPPAMKRAISHARRISVPAFHVHAPLPENRGEKEVKNVQIKE